MSRLLLATALGIPAALPLAGCLQELPSPQVGACAQYPGGAYDYGDIGVGTCLDAPTDVRFYKDEQGTSLLVVNSNAYYIFSSGSLLSIPWENLETQLDAAQTSQAAFLSSLDADQEGLELPPAQLLISDLVTTSDRSGSALSMPTFGGKLAIDPVRKLGFVSNRMSMTTDKYAEDYVYAVDLSSTDELKAYSVGEEDGESLSKILVGVDPYGLAYSETGKGRYLYVVNQTSNSVSVVDTDNRPMQPYQGESAVVISDPALHDVGLPSFAEVPFLAATADAPSDRFSARFLEGTWRAFSRGTGGELNAIGLADSPDGLRFTPLASSPGLWADSEGTWDDAGFGRTSAALISDSWLMLYEGREPLTDTTYFPRIGLAWTSSSSSLASAFSPYDSWVYEGSSTFETLGVGAPWLDVVGSMYTMWYTAYDAEGKRSLGFTSSYDAVSWASGARLTFEPAADAGSEQFEATGFYDGDRRRFRLWFVRPTDTGTCLVYAESEDGLTYAPGGLDSPSLGCLDLPSDGYVRAPSVVLDGRVLRLWYMSSPDEEATSWTVRHARGFDGTRWFVAPEPVSLSSGASWEGEAPWPTFAKATTGNYVRLEGQSRGLVDTALPLNSTVSAYDEALQITFSYGQVLGAGTRLEADGEEAGDPAWDGSSVTAPAFDPETSRLYYAGFNAADHSALGFALPSDETWLKWLNADSPSLEAEASLLSPAIVHHDGDTWLYHAQELESGATQLALAIMPQGSSSWSAAAAFSFPSLEGESLGDPTVLPPGAGRDHWHMWFTSDQGGEPQIHHAFSSDGLSWTREATPAITSGPGGTWTDSGVAGPAILALGDGTYRLYYGGFDGTLWRIGLATFDPAGDGSDAEPEGWTWEGHLDSVTGSPVPVLYSESSWWDGGGALNPDIWYDAVNSTYYMWYQGGTGLARRIGLAVSRDGLAWYKAFAPLTSGDTLSFETRVVQPDGQTPSRLVDGAIPLAVTLNGVSFAGYGATEIALAPDRSIAVVSARFTKGVYVIDTRDDSQGEFFDNNYHSLEAVLALQSNTSERGTRSTVFSPDGSRFYMTTAQPDAVLVFDRTKIPDLAITRLYTQDFLIGAISLEPGKGETGYEEDQGWDTSTDAGPLSPVLSADGRYLWVVNGNANSVYGIDLSLGAYGQVVSVTRDVGELPVAQALSPDGRYLVVANYVGQLETLAEDRFVPHATLSIIDVSSPESPTFGRIVAQVKNLQIKEERP